MKATVSIRLHWSHEDMGADLSELGVRAHTLQYSLMTKILVKARRSSRI